MSFVFQAAVLLFIVKIAMCACAFDSTLLSQIVRTIALGAAKQDERS